MKDEFLRSQPGIHFELRVGKPNGGRVISL
jgi:hypothetical protein